jgi:hypothetical protein
MIVFLTNLRSTSHDLANAPSQSVEAALVHSQIKYLMTKPLHMTNQSRFPWNRSPLYHKFLQIVYWFADPESSRRLFMELIAEHGGRYSAEFHYRCMICTCQSLRLVEEAIELGMLHVKCIFTMR